MDDVELLSETLVWAFAEGDVRVKRSVEADLQSEQAVRIVDRI